MDLFELHSKNIREDKMENEDDNEREEYLQEIKGYRQRGIDLAAVIASLEDRIDQIAKSP